MEEISALSLLRNGELCTVVTAAGTREAIWAAPHQIFVFIDDARPEHCSPAEVDEWIPALVKI